ncbi:hypothetical protein TREMEDRAFT_58608 [Tremella mesenterica DSM 1558]|uniref:uncharacterized protein n=1 Tax=Tremella mesenterica (strain ATCC 24925 / CBS 8224 / DSM 1558 / NBRC 9311 / NRRL Y-6157 / RJB 2259-6 / UBC 559-6) TaxID=578456 RepID=UPI0003F4A5FE|nr:uncharacterized protein TREMEDRAFT_58608 [Tremella mesenterica DSM 1558]EIW72445.1 hypothetical protein TREMEDRAFT_58608 [Tremella mesenterica DSM 1558]
MRIDDGGQRDVSLTEEQAEIYFRSVASSEDLISQVFSTPSDKSATEASLSLITGLGDHVFPPPHIRDGEAEHRGMMKRIHVFDMDDLEERMPQARFTPVANPQKTGEMLEIWFTRAMGSIASGVGRTETYETPGPVEHERSGKPNPDSRLPKVADTERMSDLRSSKHYTKSMPSQSLTAALLDCHKVIPPKVPNFSTIAKEHNVVRTTLSCNYYKSLHEIPPDGRSNQSHLDEHEEAYKPIFEEYFDIESRILPLEETLKSDPAKARIDGSREFVTLIAAICADSTALPPALIYKGVYGQVCESRTSEVLPSSEIFMAASEKGWTDDNLGLQWLTEGFDKSEVTPDNTSGKLYKAFRSLSADHHLMKSKLDNLEQAISHTRRKKTARKYVADQTEGGVAFLGPQQFQEAREEFEREEAEAEEAERLKAVAAEERAEKKRQQEEETRVRRAAVAAARAEKKRKQEEEKEKKKQDQELRKVEKALQTLAAFEAKRSAGLSRRRGGGGSSKTGAGQSSMSVDVDMEEVPQFPDTEVPGPAEPTLGFSPTTKLPTFNLSSELYSIVSGLLHLSHDPALYAPWRKSIEVYLQIGDMWNIVTGNDTEPSRVGVRPTDERAGSVPLSTPFAGQVGTQWGTTANYAVELVSVVQGDGERRVGDGSCQGCYDMACDIRGKLQLDFHKGELARVLGQEEGMSGWIVQYKLNGSIADYVRPSTMVQDCVPARLVPNVNTNTTTVTPTTLPDPLPGPLPTPVMTLFIMTSPSKGPAHSSERKVLSEVSQKSRRREWRFKPHFYSRYHVLIQSMT